MKAVGLMFSAALIVAIPASGLTNPVPKPSKNYAGNYQTLVDDQKASPQIARCIASGYDYAESETAYDRLGFTKDDIAAARISEHTGGNAAVTVAVPGQARQKNSGNWVEIKLGCVEANGTVLDIEIIPGK